MVRMTRMSRDLSSRALTISRKRSPENVVCEMMPSLEALGTDAAARPLHDAMHLGMFLLANDDDETPLLRKLLR